MLSHYVRYDYIAAIVVIFTPLSIFVARFISKPAFNRFKKQSTIKASTRLVLSNEMITNEKIVQSFQMEKENNGVMKSINDELENIGIKAVFFSSIANPSTRFINAIIYAGVALDWSFALLTT
ncbi:MAG: ABC transporter transmembrane domain-containing protein [Bacilli bacterium]